VSTPRRRRATLAEQVGAGRELVVLVDGPWRGRWYWATEFAEIQDYARRYPPEDAAGQLQSYQPSTDQVVHADEPDASGTAYHYLPPAEAAAETESVSGDVARPAVRHRRVLITGSRTWADQATIRNVLARVWHPDTVLVSGGCPRGADALGEQCWQAWGGQVERHPADWARHGRAAGFRRNQEMVSAGADLCLAFIREQSSGASHTADRAEAAGIPTRRYPHAPTVEVNR
jgi:YspA, cpYpsA-related SLOG family